MLRPHAQRGLLQRFVGLRCAHPRLAVSLSIALVGLVIGAAMTLTASPVARPTPVHPGGERPRSSAAHQDLVAATPDLPGVLVGRALSGIEDVP